MERGNNLSSPSGRQTRRSVVTSRGLADAIARREIGVHFQPKVHCANGAVHSFEALARWQHPEAGMIMPGEFIALAEQEGLLSRITDIVVGDALEWLVSLRAEDHPKACVNISTAELEDEAFVDSLVGHCLSAGVSPEAVIIEVTESRAIANPRSALEFMTRLRIKGFHVAIDDVGAGYASPARLARLPFSYMKLDRAFVKDVKTSQRVRHVLEHLVELGHKLGVYVVIEGVEDRETLDIVSRMGCDIVQGFYIARPMPPADAAGWFVERTRH